MEQKILDHYSEFGKFTYPGLYGELLKTELPDNVREIGELVRSSFIHRQVLDCFRNPDYKTSLKRFGEMEEIPDKTDCDDDYFPTAGGILAELYRLDSRGIVKDRKAKDKPILTCRYVSILMASILKSKGIPCRVRAGHAPYFHLSEHSPCFEEDMSVSVDHWINQYWNKEENRWVTIDVDGSWSPRKGRLNIYDLPEERFDFPADVWLNIREGKDSPDRFRNSKPEKGAIVVAWALFYDFHSLMNNEIIYTHTPKAGFHKKFPKLTETELEKIDGLARLMQKPDENFEELKKMWDNNRFFTKLVGGVL